jgi:hypothetical protein
LFTDPCFSRSEFHEIAALMKEAVVPKFPGEWKLAIGGFLFLRIICPCIYRPPDDFGTNFAAYPERAKRTLVIVAKIMQNLANYVPKFGEESMAVFSDYVQQNIPNVDAYFARMAEIPRGKPESVSPDYDKRAILRDLLLLMKSNSTKILERITASHNQGFTQKWRFAKAPKFSSTAHRLGTPVETLKYQSTDSNVDSFLTVRDVARFASIRMRLLMYFMSSKSPWTMEQSQNVSLTCWIILMLAARTRISLPTFYYNVLSLALEARFSSRLRFVQRTCSSPFRIGSYRLLLILFRSKFLPKAVCGKIKSSVIPLLPRPLLVGQTYYVETS